MALISKQAYCFSVYISVVYLSLSLFFWEGVFKNEHALFIIIINVNKHVLLLLVVR